MPFGWGSYTYAVNDEGVRVPCGHPGELRQIRKITGLDYSEAIDARRAGHARNCVCKECLRQFDLDLEVDARVCPICHSIQVRTLSELIGQTCPQCKIGVLEVDPRWLDPDWERLPVPQTVKDLLAVAEKHSITPALERARQVAEVLGEGTFLTLVTRLLDWWQGGAWRELQPDCRYYQPQWTWCKSLPLLLSELPDLAELIVIRKFQCCFRESVSQDVRRGIKNFIRKFRTRPVIMC